LAVAAAMGGLEHLEHPPRTAGRGVEGKIGHDRRQLELLCNREQTQMRTLTQDLGGTRPIQAKILVGVAAVLGAFRQGVFLATQMEESALIFHLFLLINLAIMDGLVGVEEQVTIEEILEAPPDRAGRVGEEMVAIHLAATARTTPMVGTVFLEQGAAGEEPLLTLLENAEALAALELS